MTSVGPLRALAEVRLGRQRSPQHAEGPDMVPYLRAANVKDGRFDLDDVKSMNFSPAEQTAFRLEPGDVLVTEGAGSLAAVGASAAWDGSLPGTVCFQNTLLRLRPQPGVSDRYLVWWASHAYGSGQFAAIAGGANIYHLGAEGVRTMRAPIPREKDQRRIADFLDAETARIDALIDAKQQMICTAFELLGSQREDVLWVSGGDQTDLRHCVDPARPVMYGIVLPGPNVEGVNTVPIVKGGDVSQSFARQLNRTTAEIEAPYARSRLRAGDLVLTIRGGIGDVAVVPEWADGANITQDVARIAPAASVDPEWLYHVMRSPRFVQTVESIRTGATITGINIGDIKRIKVPMIGRAEQRIRATQLNDLQRSVRDFTDTLTRQIDLLRERRQALITAAVTGEMEIP